VTERSPFFFVGKKKEDDSRRQPDEGCSDCDDRLLVGAASVEFSVAADISSQNDRSFSADASLFPSPVVDDVVVAAAPERFPDDNGESVLSSFVDWIS